MCNVQCAMKSTLRQWAQLRQSQSLEPVLGTNIIQLFYESHGRGWHEMKQNIRLSPDSGRHWMLKVGLWSVGKQMPVWSVEWSNWGNNVHWASSVSSHLNFLQLCEVRIPIVIGGLRKWDSSFANGSGVLGVPLNEQFQRAPWENMVW